MKIPPPAAVRFIYADDDKDDHELLDLALSGSDVSYEYRSVYNGAELINLLRVQARNLSPHFLLIDLNMPRVDGFSAARLIRSDLGLNEIPLFALSTSSDAEDKRRAEELGFAGFYTKPADTSELKNILEEITLRALRLQSKYLESHEARN